MERTFPQKVKPVPSCEVEDGVMTSQIRQAPVEVNRLVRTSAAMIGLAISVGTCSLPLPSQSDEAVAAEPIANGATVGETDASPSTFDVAAVSHTAETAARNQNLSPSGAVEHIVQEGQTLWQLAQLYRVSPATVALDNGISVSAVLHVGQILKIPVNAQVVPTVQVADAATAPGYYGPIDSVKPNTDRKAATQAQSGAVLNALKQKQERLRLSLTELRSSSQAKALAAAPESGLATATPVAGTPYQVAAGDTLEAIAKRHSVSLKQLADANRLVNPNVLRVDQVLVIPQGEASASTLPTDTPVMVASANPDQLTLPAATQPQLFAQAKRSRSTAVTQPTLVQSASQSGATVDRSSGIAVLPNQPALAVVNQTLPAVSLNHSPLSPVATDGSTDVATTSFSGKKPTQIEPSSVGGQQSYVENLRLEIVKLREKYQGSVSQIDPAAPSVKVAASSLTVAAPTNADLPSSSRVEQKPSRYTNALQAQVRRLQASQPQGRRAEMQSAAADLAPVAKASKPELVATASIGSQNYEPLIRSAVGQMVSPDLPPLGAVEAYLPGKSGKFNGYIWPAKGVLTSGFGYRWGRMHKGIDIAAPVGTPVFAAAAGVIITAGWNSGGYGNMVEIQHPDGSVTLYAHNSRIVVREGQEVAQGQQIADMGSTGYSTGPHSHFEVHLPGQGAVNPMAHLPRNEA